MARKDVFANITAANKVGPERRATPGYATHGASRSMISSLSELRDKVALVEQHGFGEVILELDPNLLESSFVSDRMGEDDIAYKDLFDAIRERGQDTPIQVRPYPGIEGRYQVVFGHRRVRVAKELGTPVRAIVKDVSDTEHVIAQGQENSARENLSFIERARFAQNLIDLGYERSVVQTALSVDPPMLTRMLSVSTRVPVGIVSAIGPAKSIGRDRWIEFAQQIERPASLVLAMTIIQSEPFNELPSDSRFEFLANGIRKDGRSSQLKKAVGEWHASDETVRAEFKGNGKSYSIALKSNDANRFGRFITENLERLHREFVTSTKDEGK